MADQPITNGTSTGDADNTVQNTAVSAALSDQNAAAQPSTESTSSTAEQVPSWLKEVQEKNQQFASSENMQTNSPENTQQAAQQSAVVKDLLSLKDHEEKAAATSEVQAETDELDGLKFEGMEEEKPAAVENTAAVSEAVPEVKTTENKDSIVAPDWLKDLEKQPPAGVAQVSVMEPQKEENTENKQSEKIQESLLQKISEKPKEEIVLPAVEKLPEEKEEKPETATAEKAPAEVKEPTAEQQEKMKQKESFLQNIGKNFFGVAEKAKTEIEKGKVAGIEESSITLENFERIKTAKAVGEAAAMKGQPVNKDKEKALIEERTQLLEAEKIFQEGMATVRDLIAPSSMEVNYDNLRVEGMYARTFIVYSYPRYLDSNWLSPVVNFDATMDIAQFIYPIDSSRIMKVLQKKVTQMQSAMAMNAEKGMVRDPALETAYEDAEQLRTEIQRGQEKFFQFAMYITIYADELKKIDRVSKQLESILGSKLILTKRADLRMEHGFNSTAPMCLDELEIFRNMNTGPLSTTFPFSSSDLTSNEGILYGLNRHNDSLVIFDRFSLPNANSVVFAISGAGKSYMVKLEILRYLMMGVDIIVIDPENEYEELARTVGGSYLRVSLTSDRRINPFDLPGALKDEELQPGDLLRSNIITLHGLLKIMLGGLTPVEEGLIDKALNDVYALKGITMDILDPSNLPVPTMEDLHALLITMDGGADLAQRLEKFTKGTYSGIFNKPTNVDLKSGLMVFSIRDLEDSLRPIAMYIILNYIWARIRSELKRRLMIVDEAWTMMQHEDSARFLFGLVKRARKYYLGITTITQDVEDFIKSPYGKPIVTNSAMQTLLKQSPASINILQKVFNLTEGEKYMLLNSGIGQGLFFAGQKHVAIQVIASYTEDKIVTTNPEEILRGIEAKSTQEYE